MADAFLSLNAGSSSIKFALYGVDSNGAPDLKAKGKVAGIGSAPHFIAKGPDGRVLAERRWEARSHEDCLATLLAWIDGEVGADRLIGIGHRVVHGGTSFAAPTLVTQAVIRQLSGLVPLAPLHQPHNIHAILATMAIRPGVAQIACFDTAFHWTQPALATQFAIPRALSAEGIRRYGFHGLSYEYVARRLSRVDPALHSGRTIIAHLGNGASLCAMLDGCSVDTTMGFTALDGLMMGTRCGSIDPGLLLYLQQAKGMSAQDVQEMLYEKSGLLGVSGLSHDMGELLASDAPSAREAVELFVYRVAREAGALVSSLGGLDGLVFTAGIGENAPAIRAMICERLAWLGVAIDDWANESGAARISTERSRVTVRVIPTDEERMIAMHMLDLIRPDRESEAA